MDSDPIPISALQHWTFCPRQAALIHLERQWQENHLTAEGRVLHERAHGEKCETRRGVRIVRGLTLASAKLGLTGKADIVEFYPPQGAGASSLTALVSQVIAGAVVDLSGWRCKPVEYKRGRPKAHGADHVQLAAQAMCLEEMLVIPVKRGEIYYGEVRRREEVVIDEALRGRVVEAAGALREMWASGRTPPARHDARCRKCSLAPLCLPKARPSADTWFKRRLTRSLSVDGAEGPEP